MSDLAKALKGKEEKVPETRLAKMLAALERYGEGSATSLEKMRSDVQEMARMVPPEVDEYAAMASRWMPGVHALDSIRMGSEASGLWRDGDYAGSLNRYADALEAPIHDVLWFVPGGGLIPKAVKR